MQFIKSHTYGNGWCRKLEFLIKKQFMPHSKIRMISTRFKCCVYDSEQDKVNPLEPIFYIGVGMVGMGVGSR